MSVKITNTDIVITLNYGKRCTGNKNQIIGEM